MSENDKDRGTGETPVSEPTAKRQKYRWPRTPRRPPKVWKLIDKEFARRIGITENGKHRDGTVFEAIVLGLEREVARGNKRALKVLRRYEAFGAVRPRIIVESERDHKEVMAIFAEFCKTGVLPGYKAKPSKPDPDLASLTPEEQSEFYEAFRKMRD